MNLKIIEDREGALLNIIDKLEPLAWRTYKQRYPQVWVRDHAEVQDHSIFPPYVSFRFVNENISAVSALKDALSSYKGKLRWSMESYKRIAMPGVNWSITPEEVILMDRKLNDSSVEIYDYFSKNYPLFGPIAYDDLDELTEHVERKLFGI
ncbi:hypothetical protein [Achromobacter sp. NCFB-sbj8-Ac1-l]|uniref:hypothetical protein n=1 Tax=unclassified Achromobacter TaxID=2626865 RepID=UPI004046CAC4